MVGDGDAMSVTGQIVKDMFRSAERWLGIDDPVLLKERAQESSKGPFVVERQALGEEP
jgi:hypothetical protein